MKPPGTIHVVFWLPESFYSAVASTLVEILELVNRLRQTHVFSFEFVSKNPSSESTAGISFPVKTKPSRKIDVLVLLAMPGLDIPELVRSLDREQQYADPIIALAQREDAIIAAHCGGCYLLAGAGALDGKHATISWWLKTEATRRFPLVQWDASRLLIGQDRIYTCGGGFSGLELAKALLVDLGFEKEERIVRKFLVLPPSRQFQTPYEFPLETLSGGANTFAERINQLSSENLSALTLDVLAQKLGVSKRTMSRRFFHELHISPGKWIQDRRLEAARSLLENTKLSISQVCYRIGYQDVASFSRLFAKTNGMAPGEFRKQISS